MMSQTVNKLLKDLNITDTRRWSGVDFFGLTRSDVRQHMKVKLQEENSKTNAKHKKNELPSIIKDVLNTKRRNAGPTKDLCEKSQKQRNEMIHQLVSFASSGDIRGILFSGVDSSGWFKKPNYLKRIKFRAY